MENEKRYGEGASEDKPSINPNDIDYTHPAKKDKAKEKVDIKESEIGREMSQQPADEQIEPLPQIDKETAKKQQNDSKN